MTSDEAKEQNRKRLESLRRDEARCAWDFLVYGDLRGNHADFCVFDDPCSRAYNPRPYPGATPEDPAFYEGTGIGALYGFKGSERHLWQLAGWTLTRNALTNPKGTE